MLTHTKKTLLANPSCSHQTSRPTSTHCSNREPNPSINHQPSDQSNGPILHSNRESNPNTNHQSNDENIKLKRTVVVYNLPYSESNEMAHDIFKYHHINPREITSSYWAGKKHNLLFIETTSISMKWNIIMEINKYKVDGTFARPCLTTKELENDRKLANQLKSLRDSNPNKFLKIVRGAIMEITPKGAIPVTSNNPGSSELTKNDQ